MFRLLDVICKSEIEHFSCVLEWRYHQWNVNSFKYNGFQSLGSLVSETILLKMQT